MEEDDVEELNINAKLETLRDVHYFVVLGMSGHAAASLVELGWDIGISRGTYEELAGTKNLAHYIAKLELLGSLYPEERDETIYTMREMFKELAKTFGAEDTSSFTLQGL